MPPPVGTDPFASRLKRAVAALEDGLLALLLSTMIALAGGQIVLRNLADGGLVWGDPLLRLMVLWLGVLGAMAATRENNHITMDLASRYLAPGPAAAAGLITELFAAAICALLAFHGGRFVAMDLNAGTQAFAEFPAWIGELIVPVGFATIALRYFLSFLGRLRGLLADGS
jgi:TRAP-type C4-dicarboxylate transport system permease small subunit